MQFKYPEILFFLFLLLIPILIHLFQLQKFKKEAFTNVKFLKEIELETRKSAKLKKLLILLSRLLTLASLIFAFSQPYINRSGNKQTHQSIIYLDNSFSMQAKDKSGGDQLQINKNLLFEGLPEKNHTYTLITNEKTQENLDYSLLSKALLSVDFYPVKRDINQVLLQIDVLQNNSPNTLFDIFLITDFQTINGAINSDYLNGKNNYQLIRPPTSRLENISIDSVWIGENKDQDLTIRSLIRSHQMAFSDLSISLFLEDDLYGKTTVSLQPNEIREVEFSIPSNEAIDGRISLTDHRLNFDNDLFFYIPEKIKTKVLVIGPAGDYLSRIFQEDEFELTMIDFEHIDQGILTDQDLIILNELDKISNALTQSLKTFVEQNGNLVVIPSVDADIFSYNNLLGAFQAGRILKTSKSQKRVTRINYTHPFFKGVFQKQIINFQYPTAEQIFDTQFNRASTLLFFEDQEGFVFEMPYADHKIYWLASPLSMTENNFRDSPLIVPLFLNFSLRNTQMESIYLTIGQKNNISVPSDNSADTPLTIVKQDLEFIPLQSKSNALINISTEEFPLTPGIYSLMNKGLELGKLAFNYDREESDLTLNNLKELENKQDNVHFYSSATEAIKDVNESQNNQNLWQLFIILAMVFLILEILLQKFLKN